VVVELHETKTLRVCSEFCILEVLKTFPQQLPDIVTKKPRKRCSRCGAEPPMPFQTNAAGETFNYYRDPRFAGYNSTAAAELCADPVAAIGVDPIGAPKPFTARAVAAWCHVCFNVEHEGVSGSVDPMTAAMKATMNVDSMDQLDWAAMFFSTVVVGFAVARELQDIHLCALTVTRASAKAQSGVRCAVTFLNGVRRWVFLPNLLVDIAPLVWMQGADALSVCFNTVAVLFLCEIDTVIYECRPPGEAVQSSDRDGWPRGAER
jgi:hypothetical protein